MRTVTPLSAACEPTIVVLNNGVEMPLVSFGFEMYDDRTARRLMATAIDVGYRNFFASVLAGNQVGAGQGIADAAMTSRAQNKSTISFEQIRVPRQLLS